MAYASKAGRASTNPRAPRAQGVCDRCGIWYQLDRLNFQYEWYGPRLGNTQLRVCPTCLDVPFIQNKTLVLPPDPVPVYQPRTEAFLVDEYGPQPVTNWDQPQAQWDVQGEVWP